MMPARVSKSRLIEQLPPVRGRYTEAMPLDRITWFGVGGPAEVGFRPLDVDDLCTFLQGKPADVPVTVIGVGSNLLVRDGGIPGVVIRLGRGFTIITIDGHQVEAGAAALDANVALACRNAGVAGLEFLSGVPGTIGGALRMNAGAYGREMKDVVRHADAVDPQGRCHRLSPATLGFTYRHSAIPPDWIFVGCTMDGRPDDPLSIARRMADISRSREESQPIRTRTGGSTFTNPPGHKAWELIDAAGCRGLRVGGAMVSEKHCNFLINTGTATAADIETLGEEVRSRVFAASGIRLEWEIRRIGVPARPDREAEA